MIHDRSAARSPLFLRIFLLMLICVAVTQLLNFLLLLAIQAPSAKLYTVGQIVHAMQLGHDDEGDEFEFTRVPNVVKAPWNPRGERIQLALALALRVPVDAVEIRFPRPLMMREQVYDRSSVPRPIAPASLAAARDAVIIGDFVAAFRQPDGRWIEIEPEHGFEPWRWFVLIWLVFSAIAVAPFAWALAHRLAKPIGAFAAAAERLGRDPRAAPLELDGPAEIAEAAHAFNQMQARLNRYVDDRAIVIAAIAHDLRTPLMRLGLRIEEAPEALRETCENDIREMQAMISAAMTYVRDTSTKGPRRPLDLRSLAETVVDDLSDRGEAVGLDTGEPVVLDGNPVAIKSMLSNLVVNAVKYAGSAEVSLSQVDGHAMIEIRDEGPGIPSEDLERVFEPFFRGERSRNRDTGGIGLGLASARAVARAHGGDVTLEIRVGAGLLARVMLPV
jgi:two-component system OmpR family sensor kinase